MHPASMRRPARQPGAQVIGRLELASGSITIQHANGVVDIVKAGDALLKGDVVMTGEDSSLTLSLIDGTALNMGASARMVLAELTYNSNSASNSAVISLVKGAFTFVAGQVAHTGDMKVTTPVATLGIRGTTVGAYLDADITGNVYRLTSTLLEDPGGGSGRYDVFDPVTGVVLHTISSTSTQVAFTPAPNQVLVQEAAKSPAIVQQELAVAQILFPIFLANPANAQQQTPQPPNNSLAPPQEQPQPPQETASNNAAAINTIAIITTADTKATQGPGTQFVATGTSGDTGSTTSALSISIATIVGNNIVNLSKAQAGFVIGGGETGADGHTVTVAILDNSGRIVDSYTTVAAGGSWSVSVSSRDATALRDGTYTVTASVSNAAGAPASVTQSVLVDQTPPTITIAAVAGDSNINLARAEAGFAIGGGESGADGQTVTVAILDSGGRIVDSYTTVAAGGSWSVNVSSRDATALRDGTYTVTASVADAAGNPASATQSLTVDETAPTITIAAITGDNHINLVEAQGGFAISGGESGANGQTVTVAILDSDGSIVDSYTTTAAGGSWSVSVRASDAIALRDGTYTVTASVADAAGNPASATQSLTVDETVPTITIAAITGDNRINLAEAQAGFAIGGSETGADGQTVTVAILDSGGRIADSYTTVAVAGAWSVSVRASDAIALRDVTYTVTASVADAAGNPAGATQTLSVDETLPNVAITGISPDTGSSQSDGITNVAVVSISGTAEANSTVGVFDDSTPVGTTTANSAGQWSLANVTLSPGINHLTANATDTAGNSSATPTTFVATLDTGEQVTVTLNGLIGGNALEDRTITAIVSAANNDVPNSGVNYTWSVSHDGGNTWSAVGGNSGTYTPSESDEGGLLRVAVSFTDVAGNAESASAVAGVVPLVTIADNTLSVTPDGSVALGIGVIQEPTPDDTISVTVSFNAGPDAPTISAGNGATGHPVTSGGITTYTFGLADVNSGLSFTNHGDQSDVLTVKGILNGNILGSTQTITVADPPVSEAVIPTDTWTSALNGNWSSSYWSSGVPTSNTDVLIDTAGAYTIAVSQPAVANSLTISAVGTTVKDNVSLALSSTLNLASGTFELNNGSLQTTLLTIGLAGLLLAEHGTYAMSMPLVNGGQFVVASNGTMIDITGTLSGLGSFTINSGATLQFSSGLHTISGALADNGTVEVTNGTLEVAGSCSGSGDLRIDAAAVLQLDGANALNVAFGGSTGELVLKDPAEFTGTISGLTGTDRIDLANIDWATAQLSNVSYSASTNITTLVITDGVHTDTVRLMGDYTGSSWTFSSDGSGGAVMVDPITTVVALDASTGSATTTKDEPSSVSSDLFVSIASEDSLFTALSRGGRHAVWNTSDHDADLQFFDAPGHAAGQGLLEFPSVFAAQDTPLSVLAVPFTNAAFSTTASVSDQFRFTDTTTAAHGSNLHTVELLSPGAAQVAPDPAPGNPHDDESDSQPPTAVLDRSSDHDGPRGEAYGFGHSEGRNASADDSNTNFDGPPGRALEHALEAGRESHRDDDAGQSSAHDATNGHHHSGDEPGPQSVEQVSQFVPPGRAAEHTLETGRGSQRDDSGQSSAHEATNDHHRAGGTNTSTDGSGPQSIELPTQFALHTPAHNSRPGLSDGVESSPVSSANSAGAFEKTGLLRLDPTADQFHFPDAKTGGAESNHIHIPEANVGAQGHNLQTLIDAAAPPDHLLTAATNDASLPTGINPMPQADPAIVHSHHGMA
jgi:hypothetical protein